MLGKIMVDSIFFAVFGFVLSMPFLVRIVVGAVKPRPSGRGILAGFHKKKR